MEAFSLPRAVDGPSLLSISDAVISGGGTINREAAGMGIPAFSIFGGKLGAVDRALEAAGKLQSVRSLEELHRIVFCKRESKPLETLRDFRVRDTILGAIEAFDTRKGKGGQ